MKKVIKPDFNREALKGKTKAQFMEIHKDAFPKEFLEAEYERLFGKEDKPAK